MGDTVVTVEGREIALSMAGENQVDGILPEDVSGLARLTVKMGEGVHSVNLMIFEAGAAESDMQAK